MIKISKTSKLDGIKSWSLQALDTCPGSLNGDGTLVDACSGCYATTGNYRFPNVKAPRLHNRDNWQRLEWVEDMVNALNNDRYFRWFDSGDMYALGLAEKIYQVMKLTPWVKHWLPTRMHKFPKYRRVLSDMKQLDNVSVRFSSDSVTGDYVPGLHGSVIIPSVLNWVSMPKKENVEVCNAYQNNGTCNGCRACWDKTVDVIAYPAHGVKMSKIIKIKSI
jgi:hypothetical protein